MAEHHLIILLLHVHLKLEEVQHKVLNPVFLEVVVLVMQVVILIQHVLYTLVVGVVLTLLVQLEINVLQQVRVPGDLEKI